MSRTDKINHQVYDSEQIVKAYSKASELQKAEETIFKILENQLSGMRMLDIGIGGGRTTAHVASKVKEYTGIDYAQNMIAACERRFIVDRVHMKFRQMDVRSMNAFANQAFDFVLFSYNGIDYMPHEDRLKAMKEIKRVIKPEGYFCFSSHNFYYLEHYLDAPFCLNPIRWWQMIKRSREVKEMMKNKEKIQYAMVSDGGEEFRVRTYYVKPLEQIQQLKDFGFDRVRAFSEQTGQEIQDQTKLDNFKYDRWLYYLCQAGR